MVAGVLVLLFLAATGAAVFAFLAEARATRNRRIAEDSVNELAALAGQSEEVPSEAPAILQFRKQLLGKAEEIYGQFSSRDRSSEDLRRATAMGAFRRGDLERLSGETDKAIEAYQTAVRQLGSLVQEFRSNAEYRKDLGNVYNWLGETERPIPTRRAEAESAYDHAIDLQAGLAREFPNNSDYRQALARTYNNRGIVREDADHYHEADADYRQAIALLKAAIRTQPGGAKLPDSFRQDLARATNNLAELIRRTKGPEEARSLYEEAVGLGKKLMDGNPDNREYKFEYAEYLNDSAMALQSEDPGEAKQRNQTAIDLITQLGEPAPYLQMQLGLLHSARGGMATDERDAAAEYQQAIEAFESVPTESRNLYFHVQYGQALARLAEVSTVPKQKTIDLLRKAIDEQNAAHSSINLAWDHYYLAVAYQDINSFDNMRQAIDNSRRYLPDLPEAQRQELTKYLNDLSGSKK
jgi:tetratricopeptide (TPR) repeat protein